MIVPLYDGYGPILYGDGVPIGDVVECLATSTLERVLAAGIAPRAAPACNTPEQIAAVTHELRRRRAKGDRFPWLSRVG